MIMAEKYRGKIVDIHAHLGSFGKYKTVGLSNFWSKLTLSELLSYMERRGIGKAVVLPAEDVDDLEDEGFYIPTDVVLEACKLVPDKLIPFCWFDPRDPQLLDKIKDYIVNRGCRGVGEIKSRLRVDHSILRRVYELCGKLEVSVLLHVENRYNYDIEAFKKMAEEYSNTIFIVHGQGWWREISRNADPSYWKKRELVAPEENYPKGKVVPGGRVEEILREYSNVYADLSAYSGYNALTRDLDYTKIFLRKYYRKLIYGTDGLDYFCPKYDLMKVLLDLNLEDTIYEHIFYRNALSLLNLT